MTLQQREKVEKILTDLKAIASELNTIDTVSMTTEAEIIRFDTAQFDLSITIDSVEELLKER